MNAVTIIHYDSRTSPFRSEFYREMLNNERLRIVKEDILTQKTHEEILFYVLDTKCEIKVGETTGKLIFPIYEH